MAIKARHAFMLGGLTATVGILTAAVSLKRNNDINVVDELDKRVPNPVFKKRKKYLVDDENDTTVKEDVKD